MANTVVNIVKMGGIGKFNIYTTKDKEINIDFNKIIPRPKEYENTVAGDSQEFAVYYYLTDRNSKELSSELFNKYKIIFFPFDFSPKKSLKTIIKKYKDYKINGDLDKYYQRGKTYIELFDKYSATDWYTWSCKNWGCKWNACYTEIIDNDTIRFETANSPASGIFIELSKQHPDKELEADVSDVDFDPNIRYIDKYKNGILIETSRLEFNEEIEQWEEVYYHKERV